MALVVILITYVSWQKSIGIITWFFYLVFTGLVLGATMVPGPNIVAIILTPFLIIGPFCLFFNLKFTDVLFLNVENNNLIFDIALTIKEQMLPYPELGSLWTGLLFLAVFWDNSNPDDEKYKAYDPRKIAEYTHNNPAEARSFLLKIILAVTAMLINSPTVTTMFTWFLFYLLIKNVVYMDLKNHGQENDFYKGLIIYLLIFIPYAVFVTNKAPLDALISIITMNP